MKKTAMGKTLPSAKKKINQDDLRRIMSEQKLKLSQSVKKIESPLAKYTAEGHLTCIVCESVVRSESVWTIHLNSKQHRDNIAKLKRRKENETVAFQTPAPVTLFKRPASVLISVPSKKVKGILKNSTPHVPLDFSHYSKTAKFERDVRVDKGALESLAVNGDSDEEESSERGGEKEEERVETVDSKKTLQDEALPEGFFDDPLLDAKARNVEYKDPIEEEWEKFQKEIKEETFLSAQIISEDQDEATAERQIDEIDEQMRNWSRVIHLERKKEAVHGGLTCGADGTSGGGGARAHDQELSSADEDEFDEYLDWRSKKSYK